MQVWQLLLSDSDPIIRFLIGVVELTFDSGRQIIPGWRLCAGLCRQSYLSQINVTLRVFEPYLMANRDHLTSVRHKSYLFKLFTLTTWGRL